MTGLPVAANHVGMFVPWWKIRVYHNCCLAVIGPDGIPAFGFEEERGQSSAILTSVRDSGVRADENLTILEGMAEADVRAGRASILFTHPDEKSLEKFLQATKLVGNYCFLNFIRRMLSV